MMHTQYRKKKKKRLKMKEKVSDLGYKNEKILHMSQYMKRNA